jgi:hypothetical protein
MPFYIQDVFAEKWLGSLMIFLKNHQAYTLEMPFKTYSQTCALKIRL